MYQCVVNTTAHNDYEMAILHLILLYMSYHFDKCDKTYCLTTPMRYAKHCSYSVMSSDIHHTRGRNDLIKMAVKSPIGT